LNTHIRGRRPPSGKRLIGALDFRGATTIQYRSDTPRRPGDVNLAPPQGHLTASPTPAKPIYDQGAHYGADQGADNESLDIYRTSLPNNNLHQQHRKYLKTPGPGLTAQQTVTSRVSYRVSGLTVQGRGGAFSHGRRVPFFPYKRLRFSFAARPGATSRPRRHEGGGPEHT
jgi:hypothetical protein